MNAPAEKPFDPHADIASSDDRDDAPGRAPDAGAMPAETAPDLFEELVDVGAASFPRKIQEAVFGADDRQRITATDQLPWRVNASLRITARDGSQWSGTGWFISPRTLITAGHCVYISGSGVPGRDGWVRGIAVMPARNGAALPLGVVTATAFRSVRGWTERGERASDYGAIQLTTPLGRSTGLRRFAVREEGRLVGVEAHVAGYPADKPPGTLWHHALPLQSVDPRQIFYTIDTAGGQSGAALYVVENGEPVAVGIHTYGGGASNSATRITPEVFENLRLWSL